MLSRSSRLVHVTPRVASRPLAGTLVALALLLQTMFTLPLAVRMAVDTLWWAQIGSALCSTGSHADHQLPTTPLLPHPHDQCLICHGSTASFGTLTTVLIFVITVSVAPLVERANWNSVPHPGGRFDTYLSRAPPASA